MISTQEKIKHLFITCLCLYIILTSNSQAQLLWEISGNNLKQASYLYGTLHVAPKKEFYLNPKVKKTIEKCDVLALEVVVKFKDMMGMAPMMVLENGKTMKDFLSPTEFQRFQEYCLNTLKMKEKKFNRYLRLKPFWIGSDLLVQQLGKIKAVEKELEKLAKKSKMPVVGLESISFQMETINKMPLEQGFNQLMQGLGQEMVEFRKLLSAYKSENLKSMYELMEASEAQSPGFVELFLNIRNRNWIPVIEAMIRDKSAFIAVGAAHLPGEQGVIQLLINQGYEVKSVQ
jgi:uncharacterized protein YbaP (TraB family)